MGESLPDGLVGVREIHVLADYSDADPALRLPVLAHHLDPLPQVRVPALDAHLLEEEGVEALGVVEEGQLVDGGPSVVAGDHPVELDIREARDLAPHPLVYGLGRPDDQGVGLDADLLQLLDGVLGWLGLELAARDRGHEGHVHRERVLPAHLVDDLARRLEEGDRLHVADCPPDLD